VLLTEDDAQIVEHSDLILGLEADASFSDATLTLDPQTALVAYTDGLMELPTTDDNMLGEEGVLEVAAAAHGSESPIDQLRQTALERSSEDTFQDDILVVWLQRDA
jgi:serine phosphatase RsbU (regulator of sigma subunit)